MRAYDTCAQAVLYRQSHIFLVAVPRGRGARRLTNLLPDSEQARRGQRAAGYPGRGLGADSAHPSPCRHAVRSIARRQDGRQPPAPAPTGRLPPHEQRSVHVCSALERSSMPCPVILRRTESGLLTLTVCDRRFDIDIHKVLLPELVKWVVDCCSFPAIKDKHHEFVYRLAIQHCNFPDQN